MIIYLYGMIPAFIILMLWVFMITPIHEMDFGHFFFSLFLSLLSWVLVGAIVVTAIICIVARAFGHEEIKHETNFIRIWKQTRQDERDYRRKKRLKRVSDAVGVLDGILD